MTAAGAGPRSTGRLVAADVRVAFRGPSRGAPPTVALDGLSLDVAGGEIVALIGPNGCGKSTFLRVVAGLLVAERGRVSLDDQAITEPDSRIGLVFQEPRLLPWRSVADNVTYPLQLAGWSRGHRNARLAELLDLVGLTGAAALRPTQLSGGMRQRAALARALALSPEVLLLDEPFSALDALTRERFNLELLRLQERTKTTVVIVTHSIPEAIFVADRVLVMTPRPGRVAAEIRIDAPRPRKLELLDQALVSHAAAEIRTHLQVGEAVA
ncbi:MAG TPA: ABC transporter ATP-binding protein [Candidatus Limnocylindrales bacterium]|nr:ABC transporter ATP-binding protein [Candidatus Limnocylindrales bacterium]